jgi:predicted O-linked N-acetylglucosamine transferase (SPINDLY family)
MSDDTFTHAAIQLTAKSMSVADLIKAADMLRTAGNPGQVENLYDAWIAHNAQDPLLYAVLFNYGVALSDCGKLAQAKAAFERCLATNPSFIPAYINLGRTYERTGNVGLAILQWSAALDKMSAVTGTTVSHKITALNQSARALEDAQQDEAAENLLRQSLELDSRQREVIQHYVAVRQRQCKWPVIQPAERITATELLQAMSPLSAGAFADDPILQLAIADGYNKRDVGAPSEIQTSWPQAERGGPLRIGYLSSDLREHAVGYLMTEVFALHDRTKVETFAYYCGPDSNDRLHDHFRRTADHFVSVAGLSDAAAAQRMTDDGVQILVDLNGYTRDARLKLVARRPAPVIVNWLGFPGTMASPYHDYIIADDWIIPPSHEMYYTEKVLRLPCYQPNHRERKLAERLPTRAEAGLPEDAMVFCCFNGLHKLNRATYDRWLAILGQVPGSVLWLLGQRDSTGQRLQDYAVARGVQAERIVFAPKLANPSHLVRYPLADLFLDTMPYGAHTTASDALWMGVPVLTLSGNSFASRVSGSLVRSAGLPEMVCTSTAEYVEKAVSMGRHASLRAEVRQKLREAKKDCVLFDMPGLVRHLEALYEQMWRQRGQVPPPDLSNLDVYLEVAGQWDHETADLLTLNDLHAVWAEHLQRRYRARPAASSRVERSGLQAALACRSHTSP